MTLFFKKKFTPDPNGHRASAARLAPSANPPAACGMPRRPSAVAVHSYLSCELSPDPYKSSNNNIRQRLILTNFSLQSCLLYLGSLAAYIIKTEKVYSPYSSYINFEFFIHTYVITIFKLQPPYLI